MFEFKYAPTSLDRVILPTRIRKKLDTYMENGLDNLLFVGSPGTGKTTSAKLMAAQLGLETKFINASLNRNIDLVREDLPAFISNRSLFNASPYKCVILDEADYLNKESSQPALRGFIEQFHFNCMFIFTANDLDGLIPAIQSRLNIIDFNLKDKGEKSEVLRQLRDRCIEVLNAEQIQIDNDVLVNIIKDTFPDFRKTLKMLELASNNGKLEYISGTIDTTQILKFLKTKNYDEMRKWVSENYHRRISSINRLFYDKLHKDCNDPTDAGNMILVLGNYQYKDTFAVDKEINLAAMMTELMYSIKWR